MYHFFLATSAKNISVIYIILFAGIDTIKYLVEINFFTQIYSNWTEFTEWSNISRELKSLFHIRIFWYAGTNVIHLFSKSAVPLTFTICQVGIETKNEKIRTNFVFWYNTWKRWVFWTMYTRKIATREIINGLCISG